MWNDIAFFKRIVRTVIVIVVLIFCYCGFRSNFKFNNKIAYAENLETQTENEEIQNDVEIEFDENIDKILEDIDSNELDDFIVNDFNLSFFEISSFKDMIVKVLNGDYFAEYDSLFSAIKNIFKSELLSLLRVFLLFLVIVLLYEIFNNFCADKYLELKKSIKIIFSVVLLILTLQIFKDISNDIINIINKIFSFSKIIFPILLSLILLSGSAGTHSVYSSLSLFLLNTGFYIFTYILIPVSTSIFVLSVFGSVFSDKRFSRIIDIFKSIFKYIIVSFFAIFGLFSSVNIVFSGVKDGVSLRLTKYAIKNYIPIVGGYVSQGFDFVHSCAVVIKNAFGVCGIFVLMFIVLKPLIVYFVYLFLFKILSAVVALIGNLTYADLFNNVSKTISYFIAVLVGLFFIVFVFIYLLIISVSVVWWFINLLA